MNWKTLTLILSPAIIYLLPFENTKFSICPFFNLTHIPCPGCGMGRAIVSFYHLEFYSALKYNPFSYFVIYYKWKYVILNLKNNSKILNFLPEIKIQIIFAIALILYSIIRYFVLSNGLDQDEIFFKNISNTKTFLEYLNL
ncbi:MAG: DUF2752 domain-containing protein [Leptospiraceae bacterium]|nr:DUF2752 domain-containing protein [Leptospiraceae bacterium]